MYSKLKTVISSINPEVITEQRKQILQPLIDYIQDKIDNNEVVRLHFICTHNSRRSQFAQVWAQTIASHFKVNNVNCYSGGTETTALYPVVAETLKDLSFQVQVIAEKDNPVYSIKYAENELPITAFSKQIEDDYNPTSGFAAILTCDAANEACPMVSGADIRIPLTYQDPKRFDDTDNQAEQYIKISMEIARELFYVFSKIQSNEWQTKN